MEYLIRFIQMHESFRKPETEALAELHGLKVEWVFYSEHSPFAILRFLDHPNPTAAAKQLIARSILSSAIYELWGTGQTYPALHASTRTTSAHLWPLYSTDSFRFTLDSFQGSHTPNSQREIIETFAYTAFTGPIRMNRPDQTYTIFEDYHLNAPVPHQLHFGRLVAESGRKAINKYTLKKRSYIATTSMDAELSLVTANLALAAPDKLAYDPFMGTGGFPLACAHFGAVVVGSDMDGRSIRGKGGRSVEGNFRQYGTEASYLGGFVADLTNSPLLAHRSNGGQGGFLDAIICDPPYGVREGLKVLGSTKEALQTEVLLADGRPAHLADTYIPPKRPYSFTRMLDDILDFSAERLAEDGRLSMWMPVAGVTVEDEDVEADGDATVDEEEAEAEAKEFEIPMHPQLELKSECRQQFNKWSRRLLTYRRREEGEVDKEELLAYRAERLALASGSTELVKRTADSMNDFRRKYFQGFKDPALPRKHEKLPHAY